MTDYQIRTQIKYLSILSWIVWFLGMAEVVVFSTIVAINLTFSLFFVGVGGMTVLVSGILDRKIEYMKLFIRVRKLELKLLEAPA